MTVLGTIIARVVVIVRGIALAEIVVQVIIWRSFYLASPWLLWGPAAALAWGSTSMAYLRRHRPGWQLVCADTGGVRRARLRRRLVRARGHPRRGRQLAVHPGDHASPSRRSGLRRGHCRCRWRSRRGLPSAAGTALAPAAALVTASPRRASLALLFVVVAMHWLIRRMLCARAARADAALAAADQEARDQYVDPVREHRAARAGPPAARHDPEHADRHRPFRRHRGRDQPVPSGHRPAAERAELIRTLRTPRGRAGPGPLDAIEAVVGEMRARGLAVDLEIAGGAAAHGTPEPGLVPGPVAGGDRACHPGGAGERGRARRYRPGLGDGQRDAAR